MRTTVAVGRIAHGETRLARRCSWSPDGPHFFTVEDEKAYCAGALVTDGVCPEHEAAMIREFEAAS